MDDQKRIVLERRQRILIEKANKNQENQKYVKAARKFFYALVIENELGKTELKNELISNLDELEPLEIM